LIKTARIELEEPEICAICSRDAFVGLSLGRKEGRKTYIMNKPNE
jgi:hypothetical protein